ncbi:hypothetical protein [Pyrococcus abyssi]|nr:hypothetical protein [Pyrococcus abyssi]
MALLTKKNVVLAFVATIWLYNLLVLLNLTGIRKFGNSTFQAITLIFPMFFFLFVKAKPPEPDLIFMVKVLATSAVVGTILTFINT